MQKDALYLKNRINEGEFLKCASHIISSSSFWNLLKFRFLGPTPGLLDQQLHG